MSSRLEEIDEELENLRANFVLLREERRALVVEECDHVFLEMVEHADGSLTSLCGLCFTEQE